ncbi:MAG: LapA family protein [Chitinispirillaceae bacterium]|nr:LapA family protein [Chitinispirillaceae bacterium]
MKVLKIILIFVFAFLFSWVLIFTFTQEQFKQLASVKLISYSSPPIAVYWYVIIAFGIGLLLGLISTVYYFFTLSSKLYSKNKEIKALEEKVAALENELQKYAPVTGDAITTPDSLQGGEMPESGESDV